MNDATMEFVHHYRVDSVRHLLQAITNVDRLVSYEAALLFSGKENFPITINCALREE